MSFRIPYVPKEQTAQEIAQSEQNLKRTKLAAKVGWQRNLQNLAKMRAEQAADAEAARIEAERIANLPIPGSTEYPIAGLHFVNGQRVVKPEPKISQAVIKTEQLRAANQAALKK
jgi:hypothetical protein